MTAFPADVLLQWQVNPQSGVPLVPHWGWYVVLYFFIGGLTAGCYAVAAALEAVGDPRDRNVVRLGYTIAFPGLLVCAVLLILDLGRPERFWHMVFKSQFFPEPIFKHWSVISIGVWVLSVFGLFAFVSFVRVMLESGRLRWQPLVKLADGARALPRPLLLAWSVAGAFFAFFLAGYTGVLLVGTVAPMWHNAIPLGGLFLASALSTSYALLILLLARQGRGHSDPSVAKLALADRWALVIEIVLLVLVLVPLGALARPMLTGGYGVVFWIGVVLAGLIAPFVLEFAGRDVERKHRLRAALVLAGGLMLRFVIIMAPQWPGVKPWSL